MITDKKEYPGDGNPQRPRYLIRRIVIVAVILVIGVAGARYLIKSKPKVTRQPAERIAPLVTVSPLAPESSAVVVSAMGTVVPARQIVLKTTVGGELVSVADQFVPGGSFAAGETILQVDPSDYELALPQKERALSDAMYNFKLEQGRQDVAQREWQLLYAERDADQPESDLALRKPHLEKVEMDIKAAKAEVELAKLNLARTLVTAPFNSLVLNKYVDQGAFVAPQEKLAELVGTDEYWVQVSVPVNRLQWLNIPQAGKEKGSAAKIYYRGDNIRQGSVVRLQGELSQEGRMAQLLISVKDPLGLSFNNKQEQPLIIGEYVQVEIQGEELHDVFAIPRTALHNDREVWIATEENTLDIREVETVWRDEGFVLVRDNLQAGERLIISNLAVPVEGMEVRIDTRTGQ